MILAGISAPRLIQAIENERLQSATIAYASFLQQSRYQAEHDQQYYEVLFDTSNPSYTMAYLDLNGNNVYDAGEPEIEIAAPITLPAPLSPAIPAGFGNANLIGATPLPMIAGTPATFNQNGAQQVGLQFNERGLPCQRTSATASCTNVTITNAGPPPTTAPVAWITYFAYPLANGGIAYAAVTITPAGRIKVWNYQAAAGGGGNWV
jgi:Tfp pilus assembly protein FimT